MGPAVCADGCRRPKRHAEAQRSQKLVDERVEEVIRLTLASKPKGSTHWSTRKLAKEADVSQSSVSRIWRAFKLKPHRTRTFTLSTDEFFVEKVRDVVGLYMSPPDHAIVLCLDEKSQIQALERTQPVLPLVFGQSERATATYARHGTTNLFAALDFQTGKVIGECYPLKRAAEFRRFLDRVDDQVPAKLDVHLVVDNSSIHNAPIQSHSSGPRPPTKSSRASLASAPERSRKPDP